ncbi:MAG: hypothetical protein ACK5WS_05860 [Alphaproteobacteria bacterium]|jgi:hypothetical protein|nr:hypothetical protein [Candidatus Jidaibacter sp.]
MFQSSSPATQYLENKEIIRELTQDKFDRIIAAFKGNGYVYGTGVFSGVGSLIGADGTDLAEYIKSLEEDNINIAFAVNNKKIVLLDHIIWMMCSEESSKNRASSKVSDAKLKECIDILLQKSALFTKDIYQLAIKKGINLFEMWCKHYIHKGDKISAKSILAVHNEVTKKELADLLYIYYRYEQKDLKELVPTNNKVGIDILQIYEKAISEKNTESYAVQSEILNHKSEELKRLTEATEVKLEEYRKAYNTSEKAKREHETLKIEYVKFEIRKRQEIAAKYMVDSLSLSEDIDQLMKQRAENNLDISKLKKELDVFDVAQLEESKVVQEVGQVRQLNAAITLSKQERIASLSSANQLIADQIQERRESIELYRKYYDKKLGDIQILQEKLPVWDSMAERLEEWGAQANSRNAKDWLSNFLTTTHLQYKGVDCNQLCIVSIEKHASAYFECLYSAVPIISYRNDKGSTILHRFFESINEKTKVDDKTNAEHSTILNRHIIFSMLFLSDLVIVKNEEGKTPIEVASGYLKGKTSFNAIADEFVART